MEVADEILAAIARNPYKTVLSLALVYLVLKKLTTKKLNPKTDRQADYPTIAAAAPGKGAAALHGVRVVELASVAAAPSCARLLADYGADVIKVEGPGGAGAGGDMVRDLFLQVAPKERKERGVGLFFEGLNCGKKSVCMDLKKKDERAAFIEMLKGADVFVTNVRPKQLAGLGLDYDDIKDELPHLIFAHLIAWGREGPDAGLAGFDMSSFWATTGIAHAIHSPPNFMYTAYPTGFGDCATGAGLFGGICAALASKVETGKGGYVSNELYRNGIFCNAAALLSCPESKAASGTTKIQEHPVQDLAGAAAAAPPAEPTYSVYRSSDQVDFCIAADGVSDHGDAAILERALAGALGVAVESDTSKKTKGGGGGGLTVAAVESAVSVKTYAEVTAALDKAGIPYLKKDMSIPYDNPSQASCFTEWGLSDCPQLLTAPFQLSCSDEHTPGFKAVPLGAHTVAFKQNGWPERHKDAEIGGKRSKSKGKDLLVVELSEARSAAVAAGTLQFAAATGAAVVRLISEGGEDYWALRNPPLAKHLCTGKKTVKCALKDVKGYLEERAEEGKQVIFVTNVRLSQLKAADLDGPALRKSAPSVITVVVTPLGPEASEDVRGELAWFIGGGVAELMSGTGPLSDHPPPPKVSLDSLIGEMTSSSVVFGAMTVADFHRRRTGEGQVAHSSLAHCATWGAGLVMPALCESFAKVRGLDQPKALVGVDWLHSQAALYGSYMTSDGACIMFTPASPAKTIAAVKAFGLMGKAVPKVLFHTFKGIATGQGGFNGLIDGLASWQTDFRTAIGSMTLDEYRAFAQEKDLWWTPILPPAAVFESAQSRACGAIEGEGDALRIATPVQIALRP